MHDELTGYQAEEIERLQSIGSRARSLGQQGASPTLRKVCAAIFGETKLMIKEIREGR